MKTPFFIRTLLICLFIQTGIRAQINIISISVQPFNLTQDALLNVNIMNGENEKRVRILTQLFNSGSLALLTVKSQPFLLKRGLNPGNSGERRVESAEFSGSQQADYLKATHNLPSGRYRICSTIIVEGGSDKADEFCEELEADFNQYLYLVNPFDGDTIESRNPILSWTHSEPFSILSQGEYYRMVVSEIKKEQSAEEALTSNSPVMVKNYLREHQLSYPYDARELKQGSKYAWQVQKLSDGVVINKTEAWVFITKSPKESKSLKYVAVKRQLDGSYYHAYDGLVYFKFSEEYNGPGKLKVSLTNSKSQAVDVDVKKDEGKSGAKTTSGAGLKISGDNRYELDLDEAQLDSGFYTLEIKNEKNESFYLKIFLP